jgi:hypothetical protein
MLANRDIRDSNRSSGETETPTQISLLLCIPLGKIKEILLIQFSFLFMGKVSGNNKRNNAVYL